MIKKKNNTEPTIIDIWQNKSLCNELMLNYQTNTSIEAIGKYFMDTKPNNYNFLECFLELEQLCEEAILTTHEKLKQNEALYRKAETDRKEMILLTKVKPFHYHKMQLREAKIWLKIKLKEIDYGIIPNVMIQRLNWIGTHTQLYNGFDELRITLAKKNIPYFSANNKDLNNFIDSRFLIKGRIPVNKKYNIAWNADKHDLTTLFKVFHSNRLINNTIPEIANFIVDSFPGYKLNPVISYLDGSTVKKKYSLNVSLFN